MKTTVEKRSPTIKDSKIEWTFDVYIKGVHLLSFTLRQIDRWYINAYPVNISQPTKKLPLPLVPDYDVVKKEVLEYFKERQYRKKGDLKISGYYTFLDLDADPLDVDEPYISQEFFQKATV